MRQLSRAIYCVAVLDVTEMRQTFSLLFASLQLKTVIGMREFWLRSRPQVWKNLFDGGISSIVQTKKWQTQYAFPLFPVNAIQRENWVGKHIKFVAFWWQHLNVTNGKLVYWFRGESFFREKINPKKVSELFISPRYTRNFGAKRHSFHKRCLHIASKHTLNIY